jgi:hypothetical protein
VSLSWGYNAAMEKVKEHFSKYKKLLQNEKEKNI